MNSKSQLETLAYVSLLLVGLMFVSLHIAHAAGERQSIIGKEPPRPAAISTQEPAVILTQEPAAVPTQEPAAAPTQEPAVAPPKSQVAGS